MLSFPVLESAAAAAAESLRRATPARVMFPISAPPLTKKVPRPFPQECHKVGNPPLQSTLRSSSFLVICYVTCDRP